MNNTDNTSSKSPFKFPTSGSTGQNPEKTLIQSRYRCLLPPRGESFFITGTIRMISLRFSLSKRGMSRSPLARETMRDLISESSYFGRIRTFARGVTKAYDQCPLDGRMKRHCGAIGISINGFSRFSTLPDLASAEIIVTLDQESDNFVENHAEVILGHVRPLGSFLPRGSSPSFRSL